MRKIYLCRYTKMKERGRYVRERCVMEEKKKERIRWRRREFGGTVIRD